MILVLFKVIGIVVVTASFVYFGLKLWATPTANQDYKSTKESKIVGSILMAVGVVIWCVCIYTIWTAQTVGGTLIAVFLSACILMISHFNSKLPDPNY